MKVHLRMLGCRLNQSEIDTMARQFEQQGHEIVHEAESADQIIVNTCAVTREASKSSRKLIRELHRSNESAEITVTGCYAQISPDNITVIDGVKRVLGNAQKDSLVSNITGQKVELFDIEPHARQERPGYGGNRTRAFIKVQDGCDNSCTFCVTTIARGAGQSRAANEILNEIKYLHANDYQEVVLTGVHLGSYGHDLGNRDGMVQLVERILSETAIPRLRLSSLEPWDLSDGFFDLWQNERLQPHLHLPLQSGCDATLKRMRRNTTQAEFRALMQAARTKIPSVRITSDVIVGFPGETDDEWAISKAFIQEMAFDGLHVFRYSVRPDTPAAKMRGKVPNAIKKERSQQLLQWARQREEQFAQQFIGQQVPVLWESVIGSSEAGFVQAGYTHNYIRVQTTHPRILTNHITPAIFESAFNGSIEVSPVLE
ncbi:MAG: tRNA (N(6)-L-threonylcarbamoyladenosine(37)-C(2))-methylthiotransferase MtaB [Anaerolineae bacterium]|nr:tRNA (N(6)-L-threonylcarbamoyladenosine(37)-C(2))-methylthiotransferase MtaB [Anaerolineae bacterium]MDQ7036887.1 tRNA (N(6)-L-threonylcarbamoyladenosine(37)-C(2))-methylthiotransferase MtaB [Anaerolineae bacterium]